MAASIYLASKAVHGPRWRDLRAAGAPISSTWIDESEAGATDDWADLWDRCVAEASACDALVAYCAEGETPKGSLVEVGAALSAGKPVVVVGPGWEGHSFTRHRLVSRGTDIEAELLSIAGRILARPSSRPGIAGIWDDVLAFHRAASVPVHLEPARPPEDRVALRISLVAEESDETLEALRDRNMEKVADGLADTVYVALGSALEFGALGRSVFEDAASDKAPGIRGLLRAADGVEAPSVPCFPSDETVADISAELRFVRDRTIEAFRSGDDPRISANIAWLVGACCEAAAALGIPLAEVWAEVQRTNMSKAHPFTGRVTKRADGKVLKPEGWVGPDIERILLEAGWRP